MRFQKHDSARLNPDVAWRPIRLPVDGEDVERRRMAVIAIEAQQFVKLGGWSYCGIALGGNRSDKVGPYQRAILYATRNDSMPTQEVMDNHLRDFGL